MFCNQCGTDNPGQSKWCSECGTPLQARAAVPEAETKTVLAAPAAPPPPPPLKEVYCPQCGKDLPPATRFCSECGATIPQRIGKAVPGWTPPAGPDPSTAPPGSFKILGIFGIVLGAISILLNLAFPAVAVGNLWSAEGAWPLMAAFAIGALIMMGLSILQLVGGIGLLKPTLSGRKASLVYAWGLVPAFLVMTVITSVATGYVVAQGGISQQAAGAGQYIYAGNCGGWIYCAFLIVCLMSGQGARWAAAERARQAANPALASLPPYSAMAVLSLYFALALIPCIAQTLSIVFGFIGLSRIRNSQGMLRGRGHAIWGIVLSFVILCSGISLVAIATIVANRRSSGY